MRQQGLNGLGVGGREELLGDFIQAFLQLTGAVGGSVECEVQHSGGETADGGDERRALVRGDKAQAEDDEIGERILQKRVVALELLD